MRDCERVQEREREREKGMENQESICVGKWVWALGVCNCDLKLTSNGNASQQNNYPIKELAATMTSIPTLHSAVIL